MSLEERFWIKVDKRGPNECWPWLAGGKPYGMQGAHRVAFRLTHGYWPNHAYHRCNNKRCCNPNHIYDGDHKTNALDASRDGLLNKSKNAGSVNGIAKLSEKDVTWRHI